MSPALVRLVIKQEIFYFYKTKIFLVILTLHNSITTCDSQKLDENLESASKNKYVLDRPLNMERAYHSLEYNHWKDHSFENAHL